MQRTQTLGAERGSNLCLSDADIYRPKTMTLHFQTLQLQARLGHAPTAARYLISQKLRLGYPTCTHTHRQHACAKGAHSAGTLSRTRRTIPAKYKEGNAPGRDNRQLRLREVPNRTCGMCLVTIATQDSTKHFPIDSLSEAFSTSHRTQLHASVCWCLMAAVQ